jgi:hypothetical protein
MPSARAADRTSIVITASMPIKNAGATGDNPDFVAQRWECSQDVHRRTDEVSLVRIEKDQGLESR